MSYKSLIHIMDEVDIEEGDIVLLSSDSKLSLYSAISHQVNPNLNDILDSIIFKIGAEGTLLLPTYNWDFCKGKTFEYKKTPCMTGSLGQIALERVDFKRTQHPIYSFAVFGKHQKHLCELKNISSFGIDSPFAFLHRNNAKNILLDVNYTNSFTYAHYVEEQIGNLPYRFIKEFTADYIDEYNEVSKRTYSMYVRHLDKNVVFDMESMDTIFEMNHAVKKYIFNQSEIKLLDLSKVYQCIYDEIVANRSRRICTYLGQED